MSSHSPTTSANGTSPPPRFQYQLTARFEWTCYALAASPSPLITLPPRSSLTTLPSWLLHLLDALPWKPTRLLHPAWMFVAFEIASMLPRAIRGHRWYVDTFGDRYPKNRKAIIPWLL